MNVYKNFDKCLDIISSFNGVGLNIEEKLKLVLNTKAQDLIENNEIFINIFAIPSPKEMILISRKFKEKKGEHFLKYLQTQLKEEEFFVIKELIYLF